MFEPIYEETQDAVIKVIGVGGGGGNALNHMVNTLVDYNVGSVEFFSVNTDAQVLRSSAVPNTIQIGAGLTKGLGAGGNPMVGHQAAEEDKDALSRMVDGADMVFIAAGMGGGSGTGAAPVIAELAKSKGILTVAIVTKPFLFEGKKRTGYAEQGVRELSKHVDTLIIIQNERLAKVLPKGIKVDEAFAYANDVLRNAVIGITDMITKEGIVNVDFADVKTVMSEMGRAMMGTAEADGDDRAERAIQEAIASPLLEDIDLSGAKGILVNIVSNGDLSLTELGIIMDQVNAFADDESATIFGTAKDPELNGKLRVTIVATGIGQQAESLSPPKMNPIGGNVHRPIAQGYTAQPNAYPQGTQSAENVAPQPYRTHPMGVTQNQYEQPVQAQPQKVVPQHVDTNAMWSPSTIPGFMRNHNNNG
ncbi:cell division protein FtsZ [Pasteurellaceae bacterium Macca]|nr:cell division protein FtsZ [Pasteurellaceae bacterium Macca]